jgi:hypothetical protein
VNKLIDLPAVDIGPLDDPTPAEILQQAMERDQDVPVRLQSGRSEVKQRCGQNPPRRRERGAAAVVTSDEGFDQR